MFFSEVFTGITSDCNKRNKVLLYFLSVFCVQFTQHSYPLQSERTLKTSYFNSLSYTNRNQCTSRQEKNLGNYGT